MQTPSRRGLLAAAATGLLAAVAAGATVTGTAHAQSGSRLCGVSWRATDTGEHLIRLYEVPKTNQALNRTCVQAESPGGGPGDGSPFTLKGKRWTDEQIHMATCETLPENWMNSLTYAYVGNNWPSPHDPNDICNNMNRSDTRFEMEAYFLYDDGMHEYYQFQRG